MERYLYFRTQATDGDDDNNDDSACYPASSLVGMTPASDSTLVLAFKPASLPITTLLSPVTKEPKAAGPIATL